jgi:hypothetical protein
MISIPLTDILWSNYGSLSSTSCSKTSRLS